MRKKSEQKKEGGEIAISEPVNPLSEIVTESAKKDALLANGEPDDSMKSMEMVQAVNYGPLEGAVGERNLAESLGISRTTLTTLRNQLLDQGDRDWFEHKGSLYISLMGIMKVNDFISAQKKEGGEMVVSDVPGGVMEAVQTAQARPKPVPQILFVQRVPQNRRIVLAARDRKALRGDLLTVRVRDNGHYGIGMAIKAVPSNGTIWNVAGKQPRYRGQKVVSKAELEAAR